MALKNSLLIIVIAVPILIVLALIISLALSYGIKWVRKTHFAFVLPMVIPTASMLFLKDDSLKTMSVFIPNAQNYTGEVLFPAAVIFIIPVLVLGS